MLAEDLDTELAAALAEVARGLATRPASAPTGILSYAPVRGALVGSASTPAPTADRAGWWAGLTPAQQEAAVTQLPQVVGPGDGLPAWARDRANRVLLDRAETDLAAQVTALQPAPRSWRELLPDGSAELAGMTTIGTFGGGTRRVAYQQAVAKLDAVRATKQVLDQQDGRARQLLAFDGSGRSARVAVSVGDLDGAAHVAVVVPGFTTTVERDLGGADRVSADLADQAGRAAGLIGDRRDVAVVSWLGYDIPQAADTLRSSHSVVLRESAEAGAASLAAFLKGVPPDRHLTLVGHSYGSTTAGLAVARGGTQVDDLVVLGSPGLGVPTAAALDLPASHVHVLEADDDPVADLGWFGRDPGDLPDVDQLSTEQARLPDGSNGARSVGHSSYLAPGTTSQWNVAAVVAGAPSVRADRPPASW
ncbi:MAG: alpha/beta hydrolase [Lapillicoccus sp.]